MVRSKVKYNMNAIREPSEPMGGDLEYSESEYWHLLTVPLKIEHWKPASVTDVEAYL